MTLMQDIELDKIVAPHKARSVRERAGLTQGRIATELGVWPHTVQRWEAGASQPRGGLRLRYARLLNQLDQKDNKQ